MSDHEYEDEHIAGAIKYWITLSNGYNSGRHALEGGNITIH